MIEKLSAAVGILYGIYKITKLGGWLISGEKLAQKKLEELSKRPVSDREATIFDHVFSEHTSPLNKCDTSACAGLV